MKNCILIINYVIKYNLLNIKPTFYVVFVKNNLEIMFFIYNFLKISNLINTKYSFFFGPVNIFRRFWYSSILEKQVLP